MLKASASVTWRKEIRARCQQISTSTCLTRPAPLCVCVCVQTRQSRTEDSGASQVIFQWKFHAKIIPTTKFSTKATLRCKEKLFVLIDLPATYHLVMVFILAEMTTFQLKPCFSKHVFD